VCVWARGGGGVFAKVLYLKGKYENFRVVFTKEVVDELFILL
jgi:hypothetical protein